MQLNTITTQSYRSIWISDIHLGTRGCKAKLLCDFLKSSHCENLFLVGDIIDGWRLRKNWYWTQEHSNVIRRILTKAKRGTQIIYITGNHDEFLRTWIKQIVYIGNLQIVNNYSYTDLKGRKWLVTHGDLFDQITRHHKWLSIIGDNAYNFLLICNSLLAKIRNKFGLGYWSFSSFIKSQTKQAIDFIYRFEIHLANYAKTKNFIGVICGHIHTPVIKIINDVFYINDGDWVESCSAVVETYDGEFKLLQIDTNGNMKEIAVLSK